MHEPIDDDLDLALTRAATLLGAATSVAVLTGAGISAESGVATFRGSGGLWEGHRVEDVATPEAFARSPEMVWRFYNMRRNAMKPIVPNPGHRALAALQKKFGDAFTLATQNIDGLHQAAGSTGVLELHGSLARVKCTRCDYKADRPSEELPDLPTCPACGALIRPDIVWFGEMLPHDVWKKAQHRAEECDLFLVVGTSSIVYPAAGLARTAKTYGAAVIEFNLERTAAASVANVSVIGPAGRTLPEVVSRMGG